MLRKNFFINAVILLMACSVGLQAKERVLIAHAYQNEKRVVYAAAWMQHALAAMHFDAGIRKNFFFRETPSNEYTINLIIASETEIKRLENLMGRKLALKEEKEGFRLLEWRNRSYLVIGADATGVLYGCMELARRIRESKHFPSNIDFFDAPHMVLRGSCIGLQKPYYLPGRTVYEYPLTSATFPWFYDKKLWIQTLDSLMVNRMNSLYLWNGHPFASLVKVKGYEYAVEVDSATFQKNQEMYRFITEEADKRGIWVIQMFYNIIVSKPFAERHGIKTQDRERPILPLIADYTRKSIAAFVATYPHVGLMVCLGEAMEGVGQDDVDWFTGTILPGVKDGLAVLGKKEEPPIVLRAHDTDAPRVMKAALPLYRNLYTEAKFNGEALTIPEPRGAWAQLHRTLAGLGSIQIENVHILANLEPFRYGATGFIQQSVQGMRKVMGGRGLHLYPQASYWDWPYTADSIKDGRLLQIERDWIWYAAWARYAWNADRAPREEEEYWAAQFSSKYGCTLENGNQIRIAYEEMGNIAPKLLRRFGITDGNRQTLTLGMLMNQLIHPQRFGLFTLMYDCESPAGEMLQDYAEKEWKRLPHSGETPIDVIEAVKQHATKARAAIGAVGGSVTHSREEFQRLANDVECYEALAFHYAFKAEAALNVLKYQYSKDLNDMKQALGLLEKSMTHYRRLMALTSSTYLYANSMQTQQRKIPLRGVNGTYKHWLEVGQALEKELLFFKSKLANAETNGKLAEERKPLVPVAIQLEPSIPTTNLDMGVQLFRDTALPILALAPELIGLKAISTSFREQVENGTTLQFNCSQPVKLLVGYFSGKSNELAQAPELETNAQANNRGQSEIKINHALRIKGLPPVQVHTYSFDKGLHNFKLAKGACLLLGWVEESSLEKAYDAGESELDEWFDFL